MEGVRNHQGSSLFVGHRGAQWAITWGCRLGWCWPWGAVGCPELSAEIGAHSQQWICGPGWEALLEDQNDFYKAGELWCLSWGVAK